MATLTQEDFNRLVQEVTDEIQNKSNDPSQFDVAESLSGITSLPVLWNNGDTWQLKRVLMSLLKGNDGKQIELRGTETAIQWRYEGGEWSDMVTYQTLLLPASSAINAIQEIINVWNNETKAEIITALNGLEGISESEAERKEAETNRSESEITRKENELQRIAAENTRVQNEIIRITNEEGRQITAAQVFGAATQATTRLNALSDHRDEIRDGFWWAWDEDTKEWYNTGERSNTEVLLPSFTVSESGDLIMTKPDDLEQLDFTLIGGDLIMIIKE